MGRFLREMGKRNIMKKQLSALIIIFFSIITVSHAGSVDELKAKQADIKTVSARFMQEKHTKLLTKPIRSSGRFFYKQPDMIRWEYSGSVNMQVIYNGKELWLYYPELKEADRLNGMPQYSSLMHFDVSSLAGDYAISARKDKNVSLLSLVPKIKGPVRQIEMEFPGQSSFPRMIKLTDSNNEETVIIFSDVQLNTVIQDNTFRFIPEKGVTIRERTLK